MQKSCPSCGNKLLGYPDTVVLCQYCGQKVLFESNNQTQPPQPPPQPQPQYQYNPFPPVNNSPQKIIHYVNVPPRPKHSLFLHIILFFVTGGIGNILYLIYKINEQNKWDQMYNK